MKIKSPFALLLVAVLCAQASALFAATAPTPRPNILFIFSDDHAPHATSAYGLKVDQTPHLDRLGAAVIPEPATLWDDYATRPARAATRAASRHPHPPPTETLRNPRATAAPACAENETGDDAQTPASPPRSEKPAPRCSAETLPCPSTAPAPPRIPAAAKSPRSAATAKALRCRRGRTNSASPHTPPSPAPRINPSLI